MNKMDFFSKDNILVLAADDGKKAKKGGGINAILALLQEFNYLFDKIDSCAEAQDITENKQKVEQVGEELVKQFETLLGMVKLERNNMLEGKGTTEGIEGSMGSPKDLMGGSGSSGGPSAPALPATPTPIR